MPSFITHVKHRTPLKLLGPIAVCMTWPMAVYSAASMSPVSCVLPVSLIDSEAGESDAADNDGERDVLLATARRLA